MRSKLTSMRSAIALSAFLFGACAEPNVDEDDLTLSSTEQEVIKNSKPGFTFLAPTVLLPIAVFNGNFESRLSPVVRIDEMNGNTTVRTVATLTGSATTFGQLLRNLSLSYYSARFNSAGANLDPAKAYRIRVFPTTPAANVAELGFADIDVVKNAVELVAANLNRVSFVPLLKGGTLDIRFRIDKQAVDSDGDGVFDWLDNCPTVKNPPSKTSSEVASTGGEQTVNPATFTQPDSDGDGAGDACDCPRGYQGTPGACVDIDECANGTSTCNPTNQVCNNTAGSFSCQTCNYPREIPQNGVCFNRDQCNIADPSTCPAGSFCQTNIAGFNSCFPLYGSKCVCGDGSITGECKLGVNCPNGQDPANDAVLNDSCGRLCGELGVSSTSCIRGDNTDILTCGF